MLGNGGSAGAGFNRTAVGIRGLTTVTPTTTNKAKKKKKANLEEGLIDRVDRDDESNAMLMEFAEPEEEQENEKTLEAPAGHSTTMVRFTDDAFRTDNKGRQIPPTFSDVDQGNLGDAWLLASCAAIAHARPTVLLKRISRNLNDSWTVRLHNDDYRVEPEFPNEGYADPMPNAQRDTLWVALVEKAFAQATADSYGNLETGNPARAIEALTGGRAVKRTLTPTLGADRIYEALHNGKRGSAAMVLRTHENRVSAPLTADHYYAVLDAYERDGERFVKVYNPWGTKSNSRPLEDVIYEVSVDALAIDCDALYMSEH